MFLTRLISGAVLVAAAVFLFIFGDVWLLAAMGILSLAGCYEMLRVFSLHKHPFGITCYIATLAYYILIYFGNGFWTIPVVLMPLLLVLLSIYVIRYPEDKIDCVTRALFTFLYVSVLLSFVYQTRELSRGQWLVWLIVIGSWGSDTCAYCVGKLFGKHHFSELSPKKTIEGCVGGVLGAGLIAFIYSFFFPIHEMGSVRVPIAFVFPIVAIICAGISQVGDLAASAIKRNYNVKDYGKVIPGHGGILDRFDSVIFVAPFVYYLLVLFI